MCRLLQRGRGGGVQGDNVQGGGGRSPEIEQVIANQRQLTLTMTDMRYVELFSALLISVSIFLVYLSIRVHYVGIIASASYRISMFYATIALSFPVADTLGINELR